MKKLLFIPLVVLIVSIVSSVVAFQRTNDLNEGYLYIDGNDKQAVYEGEYFLLIGNLGMESSTISITEQDEGILITVFDIDEEIIKEYILIINKELQEYDASIVTAVNSMPNIDIDNIGESLLKVYLEKNEIYEVNVTKTENHDDSDDLDFVFVNIPEHVLNMKSIMESIAFTTGVFTIISFFTIVAIWYVKKDR